MSDHWLQPDGWDVYCISEAVSMIHSSRKLVEELERCLRVGNITLLCWAGTCHLGFLTCICVQASGCLSILHIFPILCGIGTLSILLVNWGTRRLNYFCHDYVRRPWLSRKSSLDLAAHLCYKVPLSTSNFVALSKADNGSSFHEAITAWLSPGMEPGEPPWALCPESCFGRLVSWSNTQLWSCRTLGSVWNNEYLAQVRDGTVLSYPGFPSRWLTDVLFVSLL